MMNQNHNTNLLKKIEIGNPLINLRLFTLFDKYQECKTDEELAAFYHLLLDSTEGSIVGTQVAYAMLSFSTSMDVNPLYSHVLKIINEDEIRNH